MTMWLMTNFGFFSIVKKEGQHYLTVRARDRQDLLNLKKRYLQQAIGAIEESEYTDYRYREALKDIALDIDYPNFKKSVAASQGKARARLYGEVWQQLMELQMGNGA
jgi:hypothetical protein